MNSEDRVIYLAFAHGDLLVTHPRTNTGKHKLQNNQMQISLKIQATRGCATSCGLWLLSEGIFLNFALPIVPTKSPTSFTPPHVPTTPPPYAGWAHIIRKVIFLGLNPNPSPRPVRAAYFIPGKCRIRPWNYLSNLLYIHAVWTVKKYSFEPFLYLLESKRAITETRTPKDIPPWKSFILVSCTSNFIKKGSFVINRTNLNTIIAQNLLILYNDSFYIQITLNIIIINIYILTRNYWTSKYIAI